MIKRIWFFVLFNVFLSLGSFSLANEGSNSVDLLEQAFSPSIYNDSIVWGDTIWTTKRSVGKYTLKDRTEINIGSSRENFKEKSTKDISKVQSERADLLSKEIDKYFSWQYQVVTGWYLETTSTNTELQNLISEYNKLTSKQERLMKDRNTILNTGFNKQPSLIIMVTKFLLRMTVVLAVTMIIYNGIMYVIKASKGENPKDILNNILYVGVGILLALFSVIIIRFVSSIGTSSLNEITYLTSSFIS